MFDNDNHVGCGSGVNGGVTLLAVVIMLVVLQKDWLWRRKKVKRCWRRRKKRLCQTDRRGVTTRAHFVGAGWGRKAN